MTEFDIAAMPTAERLQLMESLWDSFCRQTSGAENVPAWHGDVLVERLRRLDGGEESVSAWSDAKQRIRKQTEKG